LFSREEERKKEKENKKRTCTSLASIEKRNGCNPTYRSSLQPGNAWEKLVMRKAENFGVSGFFTEYA
jgi:hypothetical protein